MAKRVMNPGPKCPPSPMHEVDFTRLQRSLCVEALQMYLEDENPAELNGYALMRRLMRHPTPVNKAEAKHLILAIGAVGLGGPTLNTIIKRLEALR